MAKRSQAPESGEDRLIVRHFKPIARHPGALGLIDDAATLKPPAGHDLVLTVDAVVSDVHFFAKDPPDAVARKALRVNLSDLAAKGAQPTGFLLTLAVPKEIDEAWLRAFARGLGTDAKRYGIPLLGGDTVRTHGQTMISVTAFGHVPSGRMVRRSGAKDGDHVFVTGTIGDAALGLILRQEARSARRWKLTRAQRDHLARRYLVPEPRNVLARAVLAHASAAMDVSDGLVGDLGKLVRASGVGAVVESARVPLSSAGKAALGADPALIETVLTGGDDFEIVLTVPRARRAAFERAARAAGVSVTDIGQVVVGKAARFLDPAGRTMAFRHASFSHF